MQTRLLLVQENSKYFSKETEHGFFDITIYYTTVQHYINSFLVPVWTNVYYNEQLIKRIYGKLFNTYK